MKQEGRFIAGMSLVSHRLRGWLPVASLTSIFEPRVDLLVDHNANVQAVIQHLTAALASLKWPLVWLDEIPLDSPSWQCLLADLDDHRARSNLRKNHRAGMVKTTIDWEDYQRG